MINKRNITGEDADIPSAITKSLLVVAPVNAMRTNYVKAKTNETQQNVKCIL